MRKLFALLGETLEHGDDAVLVSIIASSGSTPRGTGACMLVTKEGRIYGTIGGGAVEYRSEIMAAEVLAEQRSRLKFFCLTKNEILDLGMICGGDVHVYFRYIPKGDAATLALVERIQELFARGEQSWLISDISPDADSSMSVYGKKSGAFGPKLPDGLAESLNNHAGPFPFHGHTYYCETLVQAGKVYIFGGGHVAQALVPALAAVGFRCVVLEDREELCRPELFPGVDETRLIDNERILDFVDIEETDYVAVMTRGHSFDQKIQAQVLKTPARYIGVIGSRKKTEKVFSNLRELGFSNEDLSRITTPIGLDIGAETPAEIAVSVAAQLIAVRAGRSEFDFSYNKKDR